MLYDIVVIYGIKDNLTICHCIEYIKKNVINKRNIYVVAQDVNDKVFLNEIFKDCIIVSEKENFIFTISDVNKYIQKLSRNGWYLQQLLKLYVSYAIKDMLDDYVVIDSDTIFLKPIIFKIDNKYMFNVSSEYHIPYFEHMLRMNNDFKKVIPNISGISHHMIFNRNIVREMFLYCGCDIDTFWIKFLQCVDDKNKGESGASEYEMYFNFMLRYHSDKIGLRKMRFENVGELPDEAIKKYSSMESVCYISLHDWMRPAQIKNNVNDNFNFGLINLSNSDIIGGEVFQSLCDATIITKDIENFHSSLPKTIYKIFIDPICESDKKRIENGTLTSFFVYTHILDRFVADILPLIRFPFILMTHNSDGFIDEKYLSLLNDERLVCMYSQNIHILHPKLKSLPIGIANSQWQHGNKEIVSMVTKRLTPIPFLKKNNKIYVNFSIGTYRQHRQKVYDILKKKEFSFFDNHKSFYDLWPSMAGYKWVACPRGNGVDTHRLWETLYAGCIPVVDRSINSESFKDFPMIYVDDWNSLSLEFLENKTKEIIENFMNKKYNFDSLSINYWNNKCKIESSIKKIDGAFILVYIGNLPHFTEDCIKQIRLWNTNEPIYLCCSNTNNNISLSEHLRNNYDVNIVWLNDLMLTEDHKLFNKTYLNMHMNGFWKYTTERFFIVEECMRKYNIENAIHLEMDNLIYFNLSTLKDEFKKLNSLGIPSDCERRFIAGISYINNADTLKHLNNYFAYKSYNRAEMEVILEYYKVNNNNYIKILPTLSPEYSYPLKPDDGMETTDKCKFSKYINETSGICLRGIFDAAALGQYLFGIDPIHNRSNTDGFINESTCFKIDKQYLKWILDDNKWRIYISADNKNWYPMYNIHVHNKNLKRGLSDREKMEYHLSNIV
jgi:hypothetical protein